MTRQIFYRLNPQASDGIALGLRSAGVNHVDRHFKEIMPPRHFYELFWCSSGRGRLILDNGIITLHPGEGYIYPPQVQHHIESIENWSCYWATFDGPAAASILESLHLQNGPCFAHELKQNFEQLMNDVKAPTLEDERKSDVTAFQLLCKLSAQNTKIIDPLAQAAHDLIQKHWRSSQLSVDAIARELNVHRSHLSRCYSQSYQCSIIQQITRYRLQCARAMIQASDESIAHIARVCGYDDPSYFSRIFKKELGISPRDLRRQVLG